MVSLFVVVEMYFSTLMYFAFVRQRPGWRIQAYLIVVSVLCLYPSLKFLPAAPSYWSAITNWIPDLLVYSVILQSVSTWECFARTCIWNAAEKFMNVVLVSFTFGSGWANQGWMLD